MPGLQQSALNYGRTALSAVGGFASRLSKEFGNVGGYRSLFRNRTALGAMAGGAYGAYSDNTSIVGGALMGAGAARYGGVAISSGLSAFARTGGRSMGFRAGYGASKGASSAFRILANDGRRAGRMIATSAMKANNGYNKFRGLFR